MRALAARVEELERHVQKAIGGAAEATGEVGATPESGNKADLEALKPRQVGAVARMNKFSQKVDEKNGPNSHVASNTRQLSSTSLPIDIAL